MVDLMIVYRVLTDAGFPALALALALYVNVRRATCACSMYERQVHELLKHLEQAEDAACSSDNCSHKTLEQCAHFGSANNNKRAALPVARVIKR
jgi:hypothetical protein